MYIRYSELFQMDNNNLVDCDIDFWEVNLNNQRYI